MVKAGRPKDVDTSSLSYFVTGGDKCSEAILKNLREQLPGTIIFQCYGQSEVAGLMTSFKPNYPYEISLLDQKLDSVGIPLPGFSLKVKYCWFYFFSI